MQIYARASAHLGHAQLESLTCMLAYFYSACGAVAVSQMRLSHPSPSPAPFALKVEKVSRLACPAGQLPQS